MWQGLDYEEINHAIEKIEKEDTIIIDTNDFYQGALWAEQRLKEKNQPIEEPQYLYVFWNGMIRRIDFATEYDGDNEMCKYIGKIKLEL